MTLAELLALGIEQSVAEQIVSKSTEEIEKASLTAVENKNKILSEKKKADFELSEAFELIKSLKVDQESFQELKAKANEDEFTRLVSENKIDEAKELILSGHNQALNKFKTEKETQFAELENKLKSNESRIYEYEFEKSFTDKALKSGNFVNTPGALKVVKDLAKDAFKLNDDGNFVYNKETELDNDGNAISPEFWLNNSVKKDYGFLFTSANGTGAIDAGHSNDADIAYEEMTVAQKKDAARKGLI